MSGGYALHIALRSLGLRAGEPVLFNAFTLSPVPGAIDNASGRPVPVETGEDHTVDVDDLRRAAAETDARVFLLSHMRGHIGEMESIVAICEDFGITLIEDCAHTMGASWRGRLSGTFGAIACFSTQTYKHINSGEGGLLVTHDSEIARRAIVYSGSYMFYDRHPAAPPADTFADTRLDTPNYSGRMDNLRAAILRPQLRQLGERAARWNRLYEVLEQCLQKISEVRVPRRPAHEHYVGSSIQFSLPGFDANEMRSFLDACQRRGIAVKWFGAPEPVGYTSRYDSWRYISSLRPLPRTHAVLATLCDIRIPLSFSEADCEQVGATLATAVNTTHDG